MSRVVIVLMVLMILTASSVMAAGEPEKDTIQTSAGELQITFLGHASLMFSFQGKIIYTDPYSKVADYLKLPKADLIVITHDHPDHLDSGALEKVRRAETKIVANEAAGSRLPGATIMHNGSVETIEGLKIEAVPAYNLVNKRSDGRPYHEKGDGNGYVITFGDKRVYIAGDTENIPEMKQLKAIDIVFLPMNLPYTMTPEMVADAAKSFRPKVLYPYHHGDTDVSKLVGLLKGEPDIEVRVRRMK